jgi:hypothetical protein
MNITAIKPVLFSSILGLAMSTAIATSGVNAAQSILNDAIHDYSDDARGGIQSTAVHDRGISHTASLLDESYHDYVSQDVVQFSDTSETMQQAEFAAFEEVTASMPWEVDSKRSW